MEVRNNRCIEGEQQTLSPLTTEKILTPSVTATKALAARIDDSTELSAI